ncbi:MAG: excinuclease ABC subunit UvrA [Myxococcota bacterium]
MTPERGGPDAIEIRGAREHNLAGFDLRIPRNRLVVITGLSGSGKSSLAFDTIYAEGQRRYVESLSAYARQFLDQMQKPDVDAIDGLSPAIAIEQRTTSRNPRSTVGTATEIYDHLRLLYARAGTPTCPDCALPIARQTVDQMTDRVLTLGTGVRVDVMAPVVRDRKGQYKRELAQFRRKGFVRARIDGEIHSLEDDLSLSRSARHDIEIVVDRITVKEAVRGRLHESLGTALKLADGLALVVGPDEEWLLSEKNACPSCGFSMPELAPRSFSFNSPHGACSACDGLGTRAEFVQERVVPDPSLPLGAGAIAPWSGKASPRYYRALLEALAEHYQVSLETPWGSLPKRVQRGILEGTGAPELVVDVPRRRRVQRVALPWHGILDELERRFREGDESHREGLARFRSDLPCPTCEGSRLRPEARSVFLGGRPIDALCGLPIGELARWLGGLELEARQSAIADRVLREIRDRLGFLEDVGLGYLTLDRPSNSLSGGEGQRIRLATQVGAHLLGVLYILDEPSIGLHPRDNQRLLASLERLRDQGNSVLVVEHDDETIRRADWVVDLGPGAGVHGGHVVAEGTPEAIAAADDSPTGAYLSGRRSVPVPSRRRPPGKRALVLTGCAENNLKDVTLRVPLGCFSVVTGVSGSGKSTLINDTLHRALAANLHAALQRPGRHARMSGHEELDKVIAVDQAPIGRTPRSNPATYSGAFDAIRRVFHQIPEARLRGYGPGRFSFNVKGGRCEACQGDGTLRIEMHFLPDHFVPCEVCRGRRYNPETLEIRYHDHSIADVLASSVEQALVLFENVPAVRRPLEALRDVGLGYLALGQSATTLSGGEAQRVKLARELSRKATGNTLYLLDEPTTGLHTADVEQLLRVLSSLVDKGNTVLVIEHHPDVVKTADHVIDLGPEGGEKGGEIVVEGTPETVAQHPMSHTGRALAPLLFGADG